MTMFLLQNVSIFEDSTIQIVLKSPPLKEHEKCLQTILFQMLLLTSDC